MDGIIHLLISAGNLMLLGMSFVFAFLGLMVLVTGLMAKLVPVAQPEPRIADPAPQAMAPAPDPKLMAAIAAAVHRYRSRPVNR